MDESLVALSNQTSKRVPSCGSPRGILSCWKSHRASLVVAMVPHHTLTMGSLHIYDILETDCTGCGSGTSIFTLMFYSLSIITY